MTERELELLIGILQKFYEDPKNEQAFQEWLKQQEKHTSK